MVIYWFRTSFVSWLFSLILIATYSTTSIALVIVDIDSSQENMNWIANDYFYPSDGRDIKANHSIRVIAFDTDQQKIQNIEYLLASNTRTSYAVSLPYCDIQYGPLHNGRLTPVVTPRRDFKGWIRTSGRFTCNSESLENWDKTRPMWSFVRQTETPADLNLDAIRVYINRSDLEENLRKENPGLKNPQWKTAHKKSREVSFYTHGRFYQGDCFYKQKSMSQHPISIFSKQETGRIGEIACDLTMMALGFIKLGGKYYGDCGIDGLYEKGDVLVVAEMKFHGNPPSLDAIESKDLVSKFDIKNKRALNKLKKKESIYEKIVRANCSSQLYLLPYGVLNDGKSYCRMGETPYSIPHLQNPNVKIEVKEAHPTTPLKSLSLSAIPLTPDSTEQDRGIYLAGFLRDYVRATGLTPQQVLAEMTGVISAPTFLSAETSATVQNFSPVKRLSYEHSASGGHGTPFASPEKTGHEKIISSPDLATSYRNLFEDLQKQVELGAGAFDAQLAQFLGTGVTNSGVKKIRLGYKAPKVLADIHKKLSEQEPFEQLLSRFSMTESKKTEYRSLFRFA